MKKALLKPLQNAGQPPLTDAAALRQRALRQLAEHNFQPAAPFAAATFLVFQDWETALQQPEVQLANQVDEHQRVTRQFAEALKKYHERKSRDPNAHVDLSEFGFPAYDDLPESLKSQYRFGETLLDKSAIVPILHAQRLTKQSRKILDRCEGNAAELKAELMKLSWLTTKLPAHEARATPANQATSGTKQKQERTMSAGLVIVMILFLVFRLVMAGSHASRTASHNASHPQRPMVIDLTKRSQELAAARHRSSLNRQLEILDEQGTQKGARLTAELITGPQPPPFNATGQADPHWAGRAVTVVEPAAIYVGKQESQHIPIGTEFVVLAKFEEWLKINYPGGGWILRKHIALSDQVETHYEQLLQQSPPLLAYAYRAEYWQSRGKYELAEADLTAALELVPRSRRLSFLRGQVRLLQKNSAAALEDFDAAFEAGLSDTGELDFLRGQALQLEQDYPHALRMFQAAISRKHRMAEAHRHRGEIFLLLRDWGMAELELSTAIKLDPELAEAYLMRSRMFGYRRLFPDAIHDCTQAIVCNINAPQPYVERARLLAISGLIPEAIQDYTEALRLDPDNADVRTARDELWILTGNFAALQSDIRQQGLRNPLNPEQRDRQAWFLATCPDPSLRRRARAAEIARKNVEQTQSENLTFVQTLAAAMAEIGEFPEAIRLQHSVIRRSQGEEHELATQRLQLYETEQPLRLLPTGLRPLTPPQPPETAAPSQPAEFPRYYPVNPRRVPSHAF